MDSEQRLKITAVGDNKTSPMFKEIAKQAKETQKAVREAHAEAVKKAREHSEHLKVVHERMEKVSEVAKQVMAPALMSVGVAAFGLEELWGKLDEVWKSSIERYEKFDLASKRSGDSLRHVENMVKQYERMGVSADDALDSVTKLAQIQQQLQSRTGYAQVVAGITQAGIAPSSAFSIIKHLQATKSPEEAQDYMHQVMEGEKFQHLPAFQKERFAHQFGVPLKFAFSSTEEMKEQDEKAKANVVHQNPELLEKQVMAMRDRADAVEHLGNALNNLIAPSRIQAMNQFTNWLEGLAGFLDRYNRGEVHPGVGPGNGISHPNAYAPPQNRLLGPLDQPSASPFPGGTSLLKKSAWDVGGSDNPLRESVHAGVVDAFRELQGTGDGFQKASFGGVGFGGGVDNTPIGRAVQQARQRIMTGDGGEQAGVPPQGSNAFAGVAGAAGAAGPGGSAFLAARRARFAKELSNPGVRDELKGMMQTEGTPQRSLEALFNRMDFMGGTLHGGLHSGFYGPINRGALPGAIAAVHHNAKLNKSYDEIIDRVMGGSHLIGGYTDQGMPTDPNGHLSPRGRGHQYLHVGGNDFTDWVGPKGRAAAERYRKMVEDGIANPHGTSGAHLADRARHRMNGALLKGAHTSMLGMQHTVNGNASVTIDLNGFPKGTKTASAGSGLFKTVKLNRGSTGNMASMDG